MKFSIRALPALLFFICLLCAADAHADPIIITGGSASVESFAGGRFTFVSDSFRIQGGTNWGTNSCVPCRAGQTVSIGSLNAGTFDIRNGPAVINGISYASLTYSGFLSYEGSIVIPNDPSSLITMTTPFTFNGRLHGCTSSQISGCPEGQDVFDSFLVGQGIATVTIHSFDGGVSFGQLYEVNHVRYDFAAPTPTPEPATMFLLGTGLAGIGAAVRRKRKASRDRTS
ncbi:MAG TPA: PEP-CTERM sorting domain-containing protein [Pyrinomonadaceae bacterium]|jgi:hypothetical protein